MQWREREGWSNLLLGLQAWVAGIMLKYNCILKKTHEGRLLQELCFLACFISIQYGIRHLCAKLHFFLLHLIFLHYLKKNRRKSLSNLKTTLSFGKQTQKLRIFVFLLRAESSTGTIASRQPSLFWFRNQWYQPFCRVKKPSSNLRR